MSQSNPARLVFAPAYNTDLPAFGLSKPFALDRGEMVLAKLESELGRPVAVDQPTPLTMADVLTVHTKRYVDSLQDAQTWLEIFELKDNERKLTGATKPLPEMIDDFLLKSGGTMLAARKALTMGLSANLGAGYHHAFSDCGRGFCVINDIAIAITTLQNEKAIKRAMVVDVDFHQGDGTASIFAGCEDVFTLSVHSEEGWPEEKQKSTLDVPIFEKNKEQYLALTKEAVTRALEQFTPDLVIFVAGSDAYEKDILPGTRYLRLALETLKARDEFIIDTFADKQIPLMMVFAGGYGPDVWQVHYNAVKHLLVRAGEF